VAWNGSRRGRGDHDGVVRYHLVLMLRTWRARPRSVTMRRATWTCRY